jgi:hypothetical protein
MIQPKELVPMIQPKELVPMIQPSSHTMKQIPVLSVYSFTDGCVTSV